ncbi:MAG TPA: LuxR C-terminal-related transcriptional regulator [Vicinamibacterales bacterium]|jgi:DNA-binding NarL/FixJ family response regulator|nr:LuxR C-terminal-related transcriptional regulator [Vicinamibacterales bacterium]
MSQRGVQLVIGKLLTDAEFRQRFKAQARACLADLRGQGIELNETEMAALVETDPRMWSTTAKRINRRLHGVMSVTSERVSPRLSKHLTQRQERVLAKVCEGLSNKEIATAEGVSESAVKATVQQLFHKARVRRRSQLVRCAIEGAFMRSGDDPRPR